MAAADRARAAFLQALGEIAPEVDLAAVRGDADLRVVVGIDSMDQLRMLARVGELLGVQVPDADVGQLSTLDAAVAYLAGRMVG